MTSNITLPTRSEAGDVSPYVAREAEKLGLSSSNNEPPSPCQTCNGDGWYIAPVCCGRMNRNGDCCCVPEPGQEQCERCCGTGTITPTSEQMPDGEGRPIL